MADEKTFTQADIDAAVSKATDDANARIEAMDKKVNEALDEAKEAKRKLRSATEISPDDVAAIEAERDKALADLGEANKQVKALTKERDTAVQSLETEQTTSRNNALNAEVRGAMNKANLLPEAAEAVEAYLRSGATVDVADGQYVVKRGDKTMTEFAEEYFSGDASKWARAASVNGGGGATGGSGSGGSGKTITLAQLNEMNPKARPAFFAEGGTIHDAA